MVRNRALRRRRRQKMHPKPRLKGRNNPASENLPPPGRRFMAVDPPLSGLLVSMVSWVLTVPPAGNLRLMAAK